MKIDEVKEKFKDEWVLVEILKEDEIGHPTEVQLITHSKNKNDTTEAMRKTRHKYTYRFYTGDIPKKGYAVAFYVDWYI